MRATRCAAGHLQIAGGAAHRQHADERGEHDEHHDEQERDAAALAVRRAVAAEATRGLHRLKFLTAISAAQHAADEAVAGDPAVRSSYVGMVLKVAPLSIEVLLATSVTRMARRLAMAMPAPTRVAGLVVEPLVVVGGGADLGDDAVAVGVEAVGDLQVLDALGERLRRRRR